MDDEPVVIEVSLAWGETDAFELLNNVVYFRYFQSARTASHNKVVLMDLRARTGVGPILAAKACTFKMPLQYADKVLVGAKVTNIGKDRHNSP